MKNAAGDHFTDIFSADYSASCQIHYECFLFFFLLIGLTDDVNTDALVPPLNVTRLTK